MNKKSRRGFLRDVTAPLAGAFALPLLSEAVQTNSTPYNRPKLKITDIRTANVFVHGFQTHVRVYTDQGIIGQGEATDAAVGTSAILHSFRRFLIGKDPLNVDALWEALRTLGIFAGAQGGQYVTALSGLEIALWDLAGKALGLPVYQLLGGKFRDKEQGFKAMKIDLDDARDPARWDSFNWTASNGEIDRMVKWVSSVHEKIPA